MIHLVILDAKTAAGVAGLGLELGTSSLVVVRADVIIWSVCVDHLLVLVRQEGVEPVEVLILRGLGKGRNRGLGFGKTGT